MHSLPGAMHVAGLGHAYRRHADGRDRRRALGKPPVSFLMIALRLFAMRRAADYGFQDKLSPR